MNPTNQPPASSNQQPPANWKLGADRDGLQGAVPAVLKSLRENAALPPHFRDALIASIEAALDGTDHNYVILHASGHNNKTEKSVRHIVLLDLETSKELL